MKIECPECAFSREVPEDRIPSHAVTATCPQCSCRFRFFDDEKKNTSARPVPHGAHIPHSEEPLYTQTHIHGECEESPLHTSPDAEAKSTGTPASESAKSEHDTHDLDRDVFEENFALDNPWDNAQKIGYFVAFYQTVTYVMFAPQRFFAGIVPQKSHVNLLVFFLVISAFQGIVDRFWGGVLVSFLNSTAISEQEIQTLLSILTPDSNIFFSVIYGASAALLKILLTTFFYFGFLKLVAPKNTHFSLVFQVVAYSSAPLLLCLVPALGSLAGFIWSMVCTFIGCRYAMRLTWMQVLIGIIPTYFIFIAIPIIMYLRALH